MDADKSRRDWVIAVTAAVIGSLTVPIVGYAVNAFKAGPRVVVDAVYGPYGQMPDLVLQKFGYQTPKSRGSLSIENRPDGAIVEPSEVGTISELPSSFGQDYDFAILGPTERFVALRIKNEGSSEAKSVAVYMPYPGIIAIETPKLTKIHYVGADGYKADAGDLLPGQSRSVRIWMRPDVLEDKPVSKIRVFHDGSKLATVRRRGGDSISSYIVSYTGPTLLILAVFGFLLVAIIFIALLEAAAKFLFPQLSAKPQPAPRAKRPRQQKPAGG